MANSRLLPTLMTRPGDGNIYLVGDGVANSTTVAALQQIPTFALSAGGTAYLTDIQIITSQKACQGGLRVHFYNASTAVAVQDNAVFPIVTADQALYQGYLDMPAFNTEDTSSTVAWTGLSGLSKALTSEAGTNVVYFQFELKTGAFTPDASQTFRTTVWVVQ